jgi:two-component system, OmpR family, sensor histidine kinase VanS
VARTPGLSVRLRFTLSYVGFLMLTVALLAAVAWVFFLRYIPTQEHIVPGSTGSVPLTIFPVRASLQHAFAPKAAAVLALLLVFGLVGGWVLAGRMLAPLTRITDAAREAARGSQSHRIRLSGRDLADAFDAMLARLEAHVAEQQRFAANASHELRTPLAITQALLDVASREPNHDREKLDERLRAVNARAIDLTEALLLLSRADQQAFTREYVDLSLLVEEAAETLLSFAEKRGVAIECSVDITRAFGSRSLLLQLTTNLLHNAIVHNLPAHGIVQVNTFSRPGLVMLTVVNTGAELTPQLVSTLTEPFQRGAGRTSSPRGGVGLGLAIVKSIAEANDGTLTLAPRAGGGLCATVQLPAAPPVR